MMEEDDAYLTAEGYRFFRPRQTDLYLVHLRRWRGTCTGLNFLKPRSHPKKKAPYGQPSAPW